MHAHARRLPQRCVTVRARLALGQLGEHAVGEQERDEQRRNHREDDVQNDHGQGAGGSGADRQAQQQGDRADQREGHQHAERRP